MGASFFEVGTQAKVSRLSGDGMVLKPAQFDSDRLCIALHCSSKGYINTLMKIDAVESQTVDCATVTTVDCVTVTKMDILIAK